MKPLLAVLAFTISFFCSNSQTLSPGMPPPGIEVGSWVKGSPVTLFNKDTNYVVEFWATWCGPCKVAIPHLTALAKQYPKTKFVGVSVAEIDTKHVGPFVKKMGEKMNYNVAIDKQDSDSARTGFMSENWLQAAGLTGIPATFVVSNNQIVYIGHPMELDSVLERVNAGKWDAKSFAAKYNEEKRKEKELTVAIEVIQQQMRSHANKENKVEFYNSFGALLSVLEQNSGLPAINEEIWKWIADPINLEAKTTMIDYDFGIRWMNKVVDSMPEPAFFDTLAWCYFGKGDKKKAVEIEKKALSLLAPDAEGRDDYEKALERFSK